MKTSFKSPGKFSFTIACLLMILLTFDKATAQYSETISSDRPGISISPNSVGKGIFQSQSGFEFGGGSNGDLTQTYIAPQTYLRQGLTKSIEFNTEWVYARENFTRSDSSYSKGGLQKGSIGARFNILEGGNTPALGAQISADLPVQSEPFSRENVLLRLRLSASQSITDRIAVLVNTAYHRVAGNGEGTGAYSVNLSYQAPEKWVVYVENYGNFGQSFFEHRWDGGVGFLVKEQLQLDLYGGIGTNYGNTYYFASIGISHRLVPDNR